MICLFLLSYQMNAQYSQVDMKVLYENHVFYSFPDNITGTGKGKSWEIGFAVHNQQEGSIFINEYSERNMWPAILRIAPTNNFDDTIDINSVVLDTLRNEEHNWNEGGFNKPKIPNSPDDFGWGTKTGSTIVGNRVFVISLPDTTFKKVMIDSLDHSGNYFFKYADLDGANQFHQSFNINQHSGKTLAYYSFDSHSFLNLEPNDWDLLFTRYNTLASLGPSNSFNYTVTGVLSGLNVEVVEVDNVMDPYTVNPLNYCYSFSTDTDVIGFDWKTFDLANLEWEVDLDRVYFVKVPSGEIWRIYLFDFEGAFTGIITFEYFNFGPLCMVQTNNIDQNTNFTGFQLYPNPASSDVELLFDLKEEREHLEVRVVNTLGQELRRFEVIGKQGLNAYRIPDLDLANGTYIVQLISGQDQVSRQLVISK